MIKFLIQKMVLNKKSILLIRKKAFSLLLNRVLKVDWIG